MAGFSPSGRLAALGKLNEAVSGSLALRLTGSLHGASTRRLLPALSVSLHAGRSVRMMNTFQFMSLVGGARRTRRKQNKTEQNEEEFLLEALKKIHLRHIRFSYR